MKKMSVKLRVTIWITLLMALLAVAALTFLFLTGEQAVADGSRQALEAVVESSLSHIEYDDHELEIDDDLDFFQSGVYITVYDAAGNLLYGRLPEGFDSSTPLAEGGARSLASGWYVCDACIEAGRYGSVWVRGVMSSQESDSAFLTLTGLAAVALPVLVVLAALGGWLLVNRAFRPVRQITAAAERIVDGDDLSERIALGEGRDEIYTLAATFDGMLDRLEAAFESEKQFTADASHELRTPVAVIISQCELALEGPLEQPSREALETVLAQARRMSALISQLLTLSRADSGREGLQLELINLSELCELVAEQLGESAAQAGITLTTQIEPELLLRGDETLLLRLLLNLAENGIKYGRPGGSLMIKLWREGGNIAGEVADDGVGIAQEHLAKIWERFYQVDPSRGSSGAGLGLAMVKYIAEAHGGSVSVDSAPGRGSRFGFRLPYGKIII